MPTTTKLVAGGPLYAGSCHWFVTLTLAPRQEAASRYQDNALFHMAEDLLVEMAEAAVVCLLAWTKRTSVTA